MYNQREYTYNLYILSAYNSSTSSFCRQSKINWTHKKKVVDETLILSFLEKSDNAWINFIGPDVQSINIALSLLITHANPVFIFYNFIVKRAEINWKPN